MPDEALIAREEFQNALSFSRTFEERIRLFEDYRAAEAKRWIPKASDAGLPSLDEFSKRFSAAADFLLGEAFWWAFEQANIVCCTSPEEANLKKEGALFWVLSPSEASPGPGDLLNLTLIFRDAPSEDERAFLEKFYFRFASFICLLLGSESGPPGSSVLPFGVRLTPLPLSRFYQERLPAEEISFAKRAALLKCRPITGSASLTQTVQQALAAYIYSDQPFHFGEAARERVLRQNKSGNVIHDVQLSPGGILDIEYLIATLQMAYGRKLSGDVRSPDTLTALYGLWRAGVIGEKHYQDLRAAYIFLTGLVQALKIHHGNMSAGGALPAENPQDFAAIGRLLGYQGPDNHVYTEFKLACQHHMGAAERLYETTLVNLANQDWDDIPGRVMVTRESVRVRLDELLRGAPRSEDVPVLRRMGFLDMKALGPRFQALCPNMTAFEPFSRTLERAWEIWPAIPNPDLSLEQLKLFLDKNKDSYRMWYALAKSEKGFRLLLHLFGTSRYLSDLFLRHRECWPWVEQSQYLSSAYSGETLEAAAGKNTGLEDLTAVYQKEILRLALADLFMGEPLDALMAAHSRLARFLLTRLIALVPGAEKIGVVGLGGLGSSGQNLGPEWDLQLMVEEEAGLKAASHFMDLLTGGSTERALIRLKIQGNDSEIKQPAVVLYENWLAQLGSMTSLGEANPWLSASCLAGPPELCVKIAGALDLLAAGPWTQPAALSRQLDKRHAEEAVLQSRHEENRHLILAPGALQDLEWSVWRASLRRAGKGPRSPSFSETLKTLEEEKICSGQEIWDLREAWLDFNKTLGRLRLMDSTSLSVMPADQEDFRIFAKVMGFLDQGIDPAEERFNRHWERLRGRVRAVFDHLFEN